MRLSLIENLPEYTVLQIYQDHCFHPLVLILVRNLFLQHAKSWERLQLLSVHKHKHNANVNININVNINANIYANIIANIIANINANIIKKKTRRKEKKSTGS